MKKVILYILGCSSVLSIAAQEKKIPVFISGTEGHKSYRIPALVSLPGGDLLAFAEGRVQGAGDFGDINIVMKRSRDQGKTWELMQTIVDYDKLQAGNPAPVVDLLDPAFPKGRIFLFYNTGNNHEGEVRKGNGLRESWYKTSADGGISWSEPVNITTQVHRPRQPSLNASYNFTEDWRGSANTPGHAMQFQTGNNKGRIYVAANHSAGAPKPQGMDYDAHGYFTDDHGKSFQLGASLNWPGSNESTAAEVAGGSLLFNSRNQKGDVRARIVARSKNGGQSWDTIYMDNNLPDPVCQGSLLSLAVKKRKSVIAFCNAADEKRRDNLTLRISKDDGRTWYRKFLIEQAADKKDNAAYSDITVVSRRVAGVLYERDNYSQIVFTAVKWK